MRSLTADPPATDTRVASIDGSALAPSGRPCEACGSPVEPLDKFCPACGTPQESIAAPAAPPGTPAVPSAERSVTPSTARKTLRCQQCASEVAMDLDQRSFNCPFCDSSYVVEFTPDESGRQRPEFVIGFAITPEQAQEKFRHWIGDNSWFRPGDLKLTMIVDKMRGIYLPFWSFSMLARSRWSAVIGEYWYRTETYTERDAKGNMVTKTRQVQETEWWPLSGAHQKYYSGYLVSGSRGLPQSEAESILPFQMPALRRYEPYFLSGWLSEEYSVEREEALARSQQVFLAWERANIASFLPGNTHQTPSIETEFSAINSDLCLLPIYVLTYRYQNKIYTFRMNGQTGRAAGKKPVSWRKVGVVALAVVLLVVTIAAVGGLIAALTR